METTPTHVRRCTIHRGRGQIDELPLDHDPVEGPPPDRPPIAGRVPIRTIMSRELLCVRPDLDIAAAVNLMIERRLGCLPVVDERRHPVGIITKFDLVEQLDAAMRLAGADSALPADLAARTADDVMMPIALTLDEHATIAHAAAMMISEDTHHVLAVARDGALVGVVSAKDIVRWVTEHDASAVRADAGSDPPPGGRWKVER